MNVSTYLYCIIFYMHPALRIIIYVISWATVTLLRYMLLCILLMLESFREEN